MNTYMSFVTKCMLGLALGLGYDWAIIGFDLVYNGLLNFYTLTATGLANSIR